ncbi:MAG: helix-turn-helix transcriptional regulator [Firmicutes bacterium]|nr:helix-turn-helix transcriptional regulator [Bacillota bacterium]
MSGSGVVAVRNFQKRLEAGEEELLPSEFANRIIDGKSPIRVWRAYRQMTVKALADAADISGAYLSQIETGVRDGEVGTYRRLAQALGVQVDDLV